MTLKVLAVFLMLTSARGAQVVADPFPPFGMNDLIWLGIAIPQKLNKSANKFMIMIVLKSCKHEFAVAVLQCANNIMYGDYYKKHVNPPEAV